MKSKTRRRLTTIAIAAAAGGILISVGIALWNPPIKGYTALLLWEGLLCLGWFPMMLAGVGWLLWISRDFWGRTLPWLGFQVSTVLLTLVGGEHSRFAALSTSANLLSFVFFAGSMLVNFLYACKNFASLRLMAISSVGVIWSILIITRTHPNLLEEAMRGVTLPAEPSGTLTVMGSIVWLAGGMFVSGAVCFIAHTLLALWHEFTAPSLPLWEERGK